MSSEPAVSRRRPEELAVLQVPESQNLSSYQFSPDSRYVAAATARAAQPGTAPPPFFEAGLDSEPAVRREESSQDGASIVPVAVRADVLGYRDRPLLTARRPGGVPPGRRRQPPPSPAGPGAKAAGSRHLFLIAPEFE